MFEEAEKFYLQLWTRLFGITNFHKKYDINTSVHRWSFCMRSDSGINGVQSLTVEMFNFPQKTLAVLMHSPTFLAQLWNALVHLWDSFRWENWLPRKLHVAKSNFWMARIHPAEYSLDFLLDFPLTNRVKGLKTVLQRNCIN